MAGRFEALVKHFRAMGTDKQHSEGKLTKGKSQNLQAEPRVLDRRNSSKCMNIALQLFEVVDLDCSGSIQFHEFVAIHHSMMRMLEQLPALTREALQDKLHWYSQTALEEEFHEADANHNLLLDTQEWSEYMEHLFVVFGERIYTYVCKGVLAEQDELRQELFNKQAEASTAMVASERLLAKAIRLDYMTKMHAREALVMLEKQADPNFESPENSGTILYHLAGKCEPNLIAALIEQGGNPSQNTADLDCPVFAAAQARRLENVRLLVVQECAALQDEHPEENLSLQLVRDISEMTVITFRDLVQRGADMNYKTEEGWSAIHGAVFFGRKDLLDCMIRMDTTMLHIRLHVNITNAKDRTALHVAARNGRFELISPLVHARADVGKRDMDGWTPLHHAALNSQAEAVICLIEAGADVKARGRYGYTPFMLHLWYSQKAEMARLEGKSLDLLRPPESILFVKHMLPVLQDEDLTYFDKLKTIMTLERAAGDPSNLRITDQFFHPVKGPNKVQLKKIWDHLAKEMLKRLRTGEVDCDPRCFSNDEFDEEAMKRREMQARFVEQWLLESTGPVQAKDWSWDNRSGYEEDFTAVVQDELKQYKLTFDEAYKALKADEGSAELLQLPADEVILQQYVTQQGAHEILTWLDTMDMAEAWRALISVKAFGEQAEGDDEVAILRFMDLVTMEPKFASPKEFWRNVYSLWLASYAKVVDGPFQNKVRSVVHDFNEAMKPEGYNATFVKKPSRTYMEIEELQKQFGVAGYETFEERTLASKCLDIVQSSIVVNSAQAAVAMAEKFSNMMMHQSKMELVRSRNEFHPDASVQSLTGCREIVLNVVFSGGDCHVPSAIRKNHVLKDPPPRRTTVREMRVCIVGEVRIILEDFHRVQKGADILTRFLNGELHPEYIRKFAW